MVDRTDGAESEPTATDTSDGSHNHRSDAAGSYPDDARSPLARWSRRAIRARLDPRQTALPEWVGRESTPARGTTPVNRAIRTVLSPRVVVAVALVVDLSLRTLVDVGPILTTLVELLAPVVSLSAGTVTPAVVGRLTTWLVLLGVLYAIAPRLFPRAVRSKLDTVGFRLLFVGIAGVSGLVLWTDTSLMSVTVPTALGMMVGGVAVTVTYFHWRADWDLFHAEGEGTAFLNAFSPANVVANRKRTGAVGMFSETIHVLGVGVVVWTAALVAGTLAAIFFTVQPLPDLLALGVLASGLLGLRSGTPQPATPSLEERLLSNVRWATQNPKGAMLSLVFAAEAIWLVIVLSPVLNDMPGFVRHAVLRAGVPDGVSVAWAFGTAWAFVGVVVCFLVGLLHLLWVWGRLFSRLPPFLAAWSNADEPRSMSVARPPGWVMPGLLALGTGSGCLLVLSVRPFPTVGWLWPLGLVPALLAPLVARHRDAALDGAVPETENRYFVGTATVFPALILTGRWVYVRASEEQPLTPAALSTLVGFVLALSTLFLMWTSLPDMARYVEQRDGIRQYALSAYLTVLAGWFAVLNVVFDVLSDVSLRALSVISAVGAVATAVVAFVESE